MTPDTPTQAAARLLELTAYATPGPYLMKPADQWKTNDGQFVQWGRYDISAGSTDIEAENYYRIASVSNVNGAGSNCCTAHFLAACDPATITTICTALQEACAERDALRADAERESTESDEAIMLTAALEQQRALKIVEAVALLPIGGDDADMPTPFQAGYQMACDEIKERLRTEVWELEGGITLPQAGTLPSIRQPATDTARKEGA